MEKEYYDSDRLNYEGEYLNRDSLEGALLDQKIEEFYDNDKLYKNIYFINGKKGYYNKNKLKFGRMHLNQKK